MVDPHGHCRQRVDRLWDHGGRRRDACEERDRDPAAVHLTQPSLILIRLRGWGTSEAGGGGCPELVCAVAPSTAFGGPPNRFAGEDPRPQASTQVSGVLFEVFEPHDLQRR